MHRSLQCESSRRNNKEETTTATSCVALRRSTVARLTIVPTSCRNEIVIMGSLLRSTMRTGAKWKQVLTRALSFAPPSVDLESRQRLFVRCALDLPVAAARLTRLPPFGAAAESAAVRSIPQCCHTNAACHDSVLLPTALYCFQPLRSNQLHYNLASVILSGLLKWCSESINCCRKALTAPQM